MVDNHDRYINVLFFVYIGFLSSLFVTNTLATNTYFYYMLVPMALLPVTWNEIVVGKLKFPAPAKITFDNLIRNFILCRNDLIIALFVYVINKSVVTLFVPKFEIKYYYYFDEYLLPILIFYVLSIRVICDIPNFYYKFFLYLSPVVALNASVNMFLYKSNLTSILSFQDLRLSPTFGAGVDETAATSAGFSYAFYLFGALMTFVSIQGRMQKILLVISITILSVALLLTQTRGALIAFIVTVIITSFFLNGKSLKIIFAPVLVIVGTFLLLPKIRTFAFLRGNNQRFELWSKYFDVIKDRPFFGYGERGFGRGSVGEPYLFNIIMNNGENIHHAHNIFINAILRGGIIGFVSLIYIFIKGLLISYDYSKSEKNPIPFGCLLMLLIAGSVDFELHIFPAAWMWTTAWMPIIFVVGLASKLKLSKTIF